VIIYRLIIPRMKSFSGKVVEKIKTYILFSITFFPESRAVCEIMWKAMVQPHRPQMTKLYGTCASRAGELRLETHTQNM